MNIIYRHNAENLHEDLFLSEVHVTTSLVQYFIHLSRITYVYKFIMYMFIVCVAMDFIDLL